MAGTQSNIVDGDTGERYLLCWIRLVKSKPTQPYNSEGERCVRATCGWQRGKNHVSDSCWSY